MTHDAPAPLSPLPSDDRSSDAPIQLTAQELARIFGGQYQAVLRRTALLAPGTSTASEVCTCPTRCCNSPASLHYEAGVSLPLPL